jgi:ABC-2 type transport system ATP-binding protein
MAPPAILVEDLVKRYGEVEALRGVSLQVPTGSVLGLLGPNGAGKTTAVRILTTLLAPDGGRAEVLGVDVTADPERVRASIGLAGQNAAVDENLTGRENLRLVGRLTHLPGDLVTERSRDLLDRFELHDAGDRIVRTYSGGMRRRLDLAAALVHEPPVLFLDEPTTGLDPRSRTELWAVIEELVGRGTTVLLTTQYLEEADRLADNIVVIDHGTVIAEGTSSELKGRLGATVIEVDFTGHEDATRAGTRVESLGSVTVEGQHLRLSVADGAAAMLEVVRTLESEQLQPVAMALREPTLDDVFLNLTGHAAEDGDGEGDDGAPGRNGRARRGRRKGGEP